MKLPSIQLPTQRKGTSKAQFISNKDETIRLFENPVLEYFSHIHPVTPLVTFTPVAALTFYLGYLVNGLPMSIALFFAGVIVWTLTEYVLHRWVFHYSPTSESGKTIHFLVHGVHHDYPRDSTRLVMPLIVSIPLAAFFYGLFYLVLGETSNALFSGFIVGYMAYDFIHYATHHLPMTTRIGRFLKTYHMRHHYDDSHVAYGVSSPVWDYVIGTVPEYLKNNAKNEEINNIAKED